MIYNGKFKVTSPFGRRKLQGKVEQHKGMDVVGLSDKHICAAIGGKVGTSTVITDRRNRTSEWGNYVRVDGDDGLTYFYCHMEKRLVVKGQRVEKGDHLGIEGSTGVRADGSPSSSGSHCHFEVRKNGISIDPSPYLGVPNALGTYGSDHRADVKKRFGFSEAFLEHIDKWPFAADAYRKLATKK